jgi:hypothetical protein
MKHYSISFAFLLSFSTGFASPQQDLQPQLYFTTDTHGGLVPFWGWVNNQQGMITLPAQLIQTSSPAIFALAPPPALSFIGSPTFPEPQAEVTAPEQEPEPLHLNPSIFFAENDPLRPESANSSPNSTPQTSPTGPQVRKKPSPSSSNGNNPDPYLDSTSPRKSPRRSERFDVFGPQAAEGIKAYAYKESPSRSKQSSQQPE